MGKAVGWTGNSRNFKFNLDVDAMGFLRQGLGWWTRIMRIGIEVVM
jgi:hypothetical protein